MPEPSPPLVDELASTDTVDGSTLAATSCTDPTGAAPRLSETGAEVVSWVSELSDELELEDSWPPRNPPANPASNATAAAVATSIVPRWRVGVVTDPGAPGVGVPVGGP